MSLEAWGVVLETSGGVYRVRLHEGQEVESFLRGRLKRQDRTGDRVVAGDEVRIAATDEVGWVIEEVGERRNELVRAGPGGRRPKVVAANLDQVLVVLSALDPPLRRGVADRFLVLAESCDLEAVLVVNKLDLPGAGEATAALLEMYRGVGYPVMETSARTSLGLDALRGVMSGRTSALVGPSGVGKSSLLNALVPGLDLRTREVSARARRGRHTTVNARMLLLGPELVVVDTPGFEDVAAWGISPSDLSAAFPEFREPAERCRFRGCSHTHEPDCAVLAAIDEGAVDRGRYESYLALMEG